MKIKKFQILKSNNPKSKIQNLKSQIELVHRVNLLQTLEIEQTNIDIYRG